MTQWALQRKKASEGRRETTPQRRKGRKSGQLPNVQHAGLTDGQHNGRTSQEELGFLVLLRSRRQPNDVQGSTSVTMAAVELQGPGWLQRLASKMVGQLKLLEFTSPWWEVSDLNGGNGEDSTKAHFGRLDGKTSTFRTQGGHGTPSS